MSVRRGPLEPFVAVVSAAAALGVTGIVAWALYFTVEGHRKPACVRDVLRDGCLEHPSVLERGLHFMTFGPTSFAYVGALLILLRLLKQAERIGAHAFPVADETRSLGMYLLTAVPGATFAESVARQLLVPHEVFSFVGAWDMPWWALFTGLGLLSTAKIVRSAAELRLEVEGTV